jgi:ribosomal protein S18 acetylase RimI-like enzyme
MSIPTSPQLRNKVFSIRPATKSDVSIICKFDPIAQQNKHRRDFVERSVGAANCFVIEEHDKVVGYAVFGYSFFEQGFVSMLYIHPAYRQQGAGMALMQHLKRISQTAKLFTSTNLSNLPMQSLLAKLGYILSGVIHHLDEGGPELVYVKYLKHGAG